jgi:hypothetical protein
MFVNVEPVYAQIQNTFEDIRRNRQELTYHLDVISIQSTGYDSSDNKIVKEIKKSDLKKNTETYVENDEKFELRMPFTDKYKDFILKMPFSNPYEDFILRAKGSAVVKAEYMSYETEVSSGKKDDKLLGKKRRTTRSNCKYDKDFEILNDILFRKNDKN